jgi:hypothetical protein
MKYHRGQQRVAATLVVVMKCWLEEESPLPPKEIDELFRALIPPALPAMPE